MTLGLLLLLLHLLLCAEILLGIGLGVLRVRMEVMPVVIFVPVWGALCALLMHFQIIISGKRSAELGVEKLKINEEIYKSFVVTGESGANAAPLEDVLLLDGAKERRSQMMSLLNDDPAQHLELLRQASMSTDVEVVHYATTAMSELNKEYDFRLQQAEKRYGDSPDDPEALDGYLNVLGDYLSKAMAPERIQRIQRGQYATLLEKRQSTRPTLENGAELVRQLLLLGDMDRAGEVLAQLRKQWPKEQQVWLLELETAARARDGEQLRLVLRRAEEEQIYLGAQAREMLRFWKGEGQA